MDTIEVEEYNDKSIVVYGDTRKYAQNFRELGGKFNYNLRGGAGWVFSLGRRKRVQDLVDAINNGEEISEQEPVTPLKEIRTTPALSPAASLAKLSLSRTARPSSPTHLGLSDVLNKIPAAYQGHGGLVHQIVFYTVPLPFVGQNVSATDYPEAVYTVTELETQGPVDSIIIRDDQGIEYRAKIASGKWQIFSADGTQYDLTFHPMN